MSSKLKNYPTRFMNSDKFYLTNRLSNNHPNLSFKTLYPIICRLSGIGTKGVVGFLVSME